MAMPTTATTVRRSVAYFAAASFLAPVLLAAVVAASGTPMIQDDI